MTADKCCPPEDKICEATKTNVPRSGRSSSTDGMAAKRNLVDVYRNSAKYKRLYSYWVRGEASAPPWVAASTFPFGVNHRVTPPPIACWVQGGIPHGHILHQEQKVKGGTEVLHNLKYPEKGQQTPHQSLIEGVETFRPALTPRHRLPDGEGLYLPPLCTQSEGAGAKAWRTSPWELLGREREALPPSPTAQLQRPGW